MSGRKEKELRRLNKRIERLEHRSVGRGDLICLCIGVAVAIVTAIVKPDTPVTLGIALVILLASLIYPVWHLSGQLLRTYQPLPQIVAMVLLTIGVAVFGWAYWPQVKLLHQFSHAERSLFVDRLKSHGKPTQTDGVWLGCPYGKEDVCLLVGQFIEMFKEAGWPVPGSQVRRYQPGQPLGGVNLVFYAPGSVDDVTPGQGVWTKTPIDYIALEEALGTIRMKPRLVSGSSAPENLIGIYFGPDM